MHGTLEVPAAATPTPVERVLAHGVEAPIGAVPWSEVGPGWMLAVWSPASPTHAGDEVSGGEPTPYTSTNTLYLVNPDGGRYALTSFPPTEGGAPTLVDWSGDGIRALFYDAAGADGKVIEVDLHTGTQTTFAVKDGFSTTPRYTLPNGKAVLLAKSNDVNGPPSLQRVDRSGNHQLTYPVEQFGSKLGPDFRDRHQDAAGPWAGVLHANRWWDKESMITVAACHDPEFSHSQLWLVHIDGATPTPLTEPNSGQ